MKTKAEIVIEHADGAVIGCTVFVGKDREREATEHFASLVLEDMESQAKASRKRFSLKSAKKIADTLKGNYTSDSGDVDIIIYSAE